MKIYNLGSLNIDYVYSVSHFVTPGETLSSQNMQIFPGGKGLNQSVALAKAGCQVIHGAVIGKDGEFLLQTLAAAGVDTRRIAVSALPTGHAVIQVDPQGQNSILLYAGTNHCVDKAYAESFLCDGEPGDILLLQNETSGLDILFETAHRKKMQIAFNPSPFDEGIQKLPLSYVTWWFCNEIEGAALFGSRDPAQIADNFLAKYPHSNLILTLGGEGSMFRNAHLSIRQAAYPAKVVDTTAAGDTFTGYFLSAIAGGMEPVAALALAARASSIAISRKGASVSIPDQKTVAAAYPQ